MTNVCVSELHHSTCKDRDCDDTKGAADDSSNDLIARYVHAVQASRIFIDIGVIRAVGLAVRARRGETHQVCHRGPVSANGLPMYRLDKVAFVLCVGSNIAVDFEKGISTSPSQQPYDA